MVLLIFVVSHWLLVGTLGCFVLVVGTIGWYFVWYYGLYFGWYYWLEQVLGVQLLDCKVDLTPGRSLAGFANSCNWAIHDLQFPQKLL